MADEVKPYSAEIEEVASSKEQDGINVVGRDAEEIEAGYWKSPKFLGTCAAIIFFANSLFFGYAVPVSILGVIDADLGPSSNISLVTLINTLCQGVIFLLVGSLSDIFGRRYFMIGGQLLGLIGSILGATSKDMNMLIGSTVFIGIAAAFQLSYPLLVMEIVPNKYRGWSQGLITLLCLPSLGFGPIIGRSIVQNVTGSWRFTYWVAAIVNGISLVLFILFYFPATFRELQSRKSRMQGLLEIDYVGFCLYAAGIICLLLALTWGGVTYPWSSARIVALLVVGIIVIIAFFVYEIYFPPKQPLLPASLFKIRNYTIFVIIGSIAQMSYYALNIFWPQQAAALYTTNNITIGWMGCTTGVALATGEIILGPLFKRIGHVKIQLIASTVGLCLFGGLMAYADENRKDLGIACTAMTGFFVGWVELVAIVGAGLVVPPETIGVAQAFFGSTRAVLGTVSSSIYLAIYQSRISTNLPAKITSYALSAGLPDSNVPALLHQLANGTALAFSQVEGVNSTILSAILAGQKNAYSSSFSTIYLSSLAFGGTALIFAFFTTDVDQYLTSFVNKTVSGKPNHEDEKPERA